MALPLAGLVLLFAAWSVYWWVADGYARTFAAEQRTKLAAEGINLVCASEAWGGYPFRFEFDCHAPKLSLKGGTEVSASRVLAVAQAYNPGHVILLVDSPMTVARAGGSPVTVTHGRAIVSLRMIGTGAVELSAEIPDAKLGGWASAADIQLFARPGAAPGTLDVAARLKDARATIPGRPPIAVDRAQAIATVDGPLHATIADLSASLGDTRAWAKGDAGIDAEHRPQGRITVATNDFKGLMSILDPQLALSDKQRAGLAMVATVMGREAKTDVAAQAGELFVGPVKIGNLPPLY